LRSASGNAAPRMGRFELTMVIGCRAYRNFKWRKLSSPRLETT
jgi:hypothetical protein